MKRKRKATDWEKNSKYIYLIEKCPGNQKLLWLNNKKTNNPVLKKMGAYVESILFLNGTNEVIYKTETVL